MPQSAIIIEKELKECFDCTEATFAFDKGTDGQDIPVLRRVKVLGTNSQNDRTYTLEAKQAGLGLYENANVNINHPSDPHKSRDFQERFGFIREAHLEEQDIYGNLYFNPKHPWAETVIWWAQNAPQCLGLSHNAVGQGRDENGKFIVDKIVKVRSVDLVADPATTKSLFESRVIMPVPAAPAAPVVTVPVKEDTVPPNPVAVAGGDGDMSTPQSIEHKIGHLVSEIVKDTKLSRSAKRKKLLTATKLLPDPGEVDEPDEDEEPKEGESKEGEEPKESDKKKGDTELDKALDKKEKPEKESEESIKAKKTSAGLLDLCEQVVQKIDKQKSRVALELDALKSKAAYREHLNLAHRLCAEAKLPIQLITDEFLYNLAEATDDKGMKALIEDRLILINVSKPKTVAVSKNAAKSDMTSADFLEALNK